jgi:cell division protease FtsH
MGSSYLEGSVGFTEKNYSDTTAERIDAEVRKIIDHEHARATEILKERRGLLEALVDKLIAVETLDGEALRQLVEQNTRKAAE